MLADDVPPHMNIVNDAADRSTMLPQSAMLQPTPLTPDFYIISVSSKKLLSCARIRKKQKLN